MREEARRVRKEINLRTKGERQGVPLSNDPRGNVFTRIPCNCTQLTDELCIIIGISIFIHEMLQYNYFWNASIQQFGFIALSLKPIPEDSLFLLFFLAPRLLSFRDVLTRRKRYSLKTCESSLWMLETNEEFLKDVSSELCQSFVRFFFSFFLFLESIQVSSTKDHSNCQ